MSHPMERHGSMELGEAPGQQSVKNWALGPTAHEVLNLVNSHVSLEAYFSPAKPWDETTALAHACERPWGRGTQLSHAWILDPPKLWDN